MTGSEKYTWGVILGVGGWLSLFGGIALSMTVIGACLGIPLAVIGLPVMVWGGIWAYQGRFQKQQEVISAGIREGLSSVQGVQLNILPPSLPPAAVTTSSTPAVQIPEESVLPEPDKAQDGERTAPETHLEATEGDQEPAA
jgi:hypothetical protein